MTDWARRYCRISTSAMILFALAVDVSAQDPIPNDAGAFTYVKDYRPAILSFRLRDVAEYKKHTQDPAGVRPDAEKFLTAYVYTATHQPKALERSEIAKIGDRLAERGSTDALVAAYRASAMGTIGRKDEARKLFDSITPKIRPAGYPPIYAMYAEQWRYRLTPAFQMPYEQRPRPQEAIDAIVACAGMPLPEPLDRWFVWININNFMKELKLADQKALADAAAASPKVDPWLGHMIAAEYYVREAGNIYKNSRAIPEPGKKQIKEILERAKPHLVAAWKAYPQIPCAATYMITVAMSGADEHAPRYWFDQAVAGQMDYAPAYTALLDALSPERGGSMGAMYRFGLECLKTERFDTDVPYVYLQALTDIDDELPHVEGPVEEGAAWRRPGVYRHVVLLFDGLQKQRQVAGTRDKFDEVWQKSTHAAIAIHAEQYADARRLFDELGDGVAPKPFENFRVPLGLELARSRIYAFTSAGSKEFKEIEEILQKEKELTPEKLNRATERLAVARRKDNSANSRAYYQHLEKALQNNRAALSGGWIDLTFQKDLANWHFENPRDWTVENEHAVVGMSKGDYSRWIPLMLMKKGKYAPPYELAVEVEPVKNPVGKIEPESAGVIVYCELRQRPDGLMEPVHMLFFVDGVRHVAGTIDRDNKFKARRISTEPSNRVLVKIWPGYYEYYLNDALFQSVKLPDFKPVDYQGIGAHYLKGQTGATRFKNVRIRPLSYGPPPDENDRKALIAYYTKVIQADATVGQSYMQRGIAYFGEKQYEPARKDFESALQRGVGADTSFVHDRLAYCFDVRVAYDKSLPHYEAGLRGARAARLSLRAYVLNFAWFLATCPDAKYRNGARAVELATEGCRESKFGIWSDLENLAAAYAEAGKFDEAVRWEKKSHELAPPEKKAKTEARIAQYQARKPCRDLTD